MALPKKCVVCDGIIPRERIKLNTCCEEHHRQKIKTTQLEHYYRESAADPEFQKKRLEKAKKRPNYAENMSDLYKRRWEKAKSDPEEMEKLREENRKFYAANAVRIQEGRKERLEKMSPEERAEWAERVKISSRVHSAKKMEMLRNNPEAKAKYREQQAEYRRRRALVTLFNTMQQMEDKS
jgi:hypothetical protein